MKKMWQLLWKDYRLNRGLMVLGVLGLIGVYLVGLATETTYTWPALPGSKVWADAILSYGHMALGVMPFIAALLGGNAIACERADRSAHFLAYLPPTKAQILSSKFIVIACALGILGSGNLLMIYVIAPLLSPDSENFLYMLGSPSAALAGCILTLGIGWLGSAYFEKPTIPVLAALTSPVVLSFGLFALAAVCGISKFEVAEWSGSVAFSIGIAAFFLGTWNYFHRVEP